MRDKINEIRRIIFSLFVFVLLASGCQTIYDTGFVPIPEQSIAGPLKIGPEWTEIIPPKPLVPYGFQNSVWVRYFNYQNNPSWSEDLKSLYLKDGRKTRVDVFLYDEDGKEYEFRISGTGGAGGGVHFSYFREDNSVMLPKDKVYTKIRLRSEIELDCEKIGFYSRVPY